MGDIANQWMELSKIAAVERMKQLAPLADPGGNLNLSSELLVALISASFVDGALAACKQCAAAGHLGTLGGAKWAN